MSSAQASFDSYLNIRSAYAPSSTHRVNASHS